MICIYCDTQLPDKGFFCPNCFKQIKCKHCSETLLKDAKICVFCSEEIGQKSSTTNLNYIEFKETETERSFKASFTDTVGQSISESFGMILSSKIGHRKSLPNAIPSLGETEQFSSSIDPTTETINDPIQNAKAEAKSIPTLNDVKIRDLAKTEIDWLLVTAYMATDSGKKEFSRNDIITLYKETGRYDENRRKGMSQYFKSALKALFIKSTNKTSYILLEKGKNKALEIFDGKSTSKKVKKSSSRTSSVISNEDGDNRPEITKAKRTKSNNSVGFIDLKLSQPEQKSLNAFFEVKKPTTQNEYVLVAMKWYIDSKKVEEVSLEEINYLLSIASKTPAALAQVLSNMIGSSFRWVTKGTLGKYQLSSIGESHIVNKLPKLTK